MSEFSRSPSTLTTELGVLALVGHPREQTDIRFGLHHGYADERIWRISIELETVPCAFVGHLLAPGD
jgi:hypothetical protein